MPISICWYDTQRTILLYRYVQRWTTREWMDETERFIAAQPPAQDSFSIIGDHAGAHALPDDVLDFLWQINRQGIPPQVALIVLCNLPASHQAILRIMHQLYPNLMKRYRTAMDMESALQIVTEATAHDRP